MLILDLMVIVTCVMQSRIGSFNHLNNEELMFVHARAERARTDEKMRVLCALSRAE